MHIIGLCGGSGSGKGAVCSFFSEYGIPSIDADRVYHEITSYYSPCLRELESAFGSKIIKNESLDRKALAEIVFSSEEKGTNLELLNTISHKYVVEEMMKRAADFEDKGKRYVIFDAPLLFEAGADKYCSFIICVIADKEVRTGRIVNRDGITKEQAGTRIASQRKDSVLVERSDFVIENNGSLDDLKESVKNVIRIIKDRFGEKNG